jgi:hypothetical protein
MRQINENNVTLNPQARVVKKSLWFLTDAMKRIYEKWLNDIKICVVENRFFLIKKENKSSVISKLH